MGLNTTGLNDRITRALQLIVDADVGITDTSYGSVVRTLISAVMNELDIQEYNIEYIYKCLDLNTASGSDLDRLVEFLGVFRNKATCATGTVEFYTTEPAKTDIYIPTNTIISTRPSANGNITEFKVTSEGASIKSGETSVTVDVEAMVPGIIYLPANALCVMNNPIVGIIGIRHSEPISGGTNEESDESLRIRARLIRHSVGKATANSLYSAIMDIDGVVYVEVVDVPRGPATCDIYIACDNMPPSQVQDKEIKDAILNTKAAGVMVDIVYPTINNIDITVDVEHTSTADITTRIGEEIIKYMGSLGIGSKFVLSKLISIIMAVDTKISDVTIVEPISNITPDKGVILRAGVITVNGEVIQVG